MPVVHVAFGGLRAGICLDAGFAVVPRSGMGCYKFVCASPGGVHNFNDKSVLPGLPWDRCVQIEMPEQSDLIIILENDQDTPVFVYFKNMRRSRLNMESKVTILQGYLRRVVWECNDRQERLEVVALALHPRVGAKSLITADVLFVLMKTLLVWLTKPSSH
jgi:hypothetical protein